MVGENLEEVLHVVLQGPAEDHQVVQVVEGFVVLPVTLSNYCWNELTAESKKKTEELGKFEGGNNGSLPIAILEINFKENFPPSHPSSQVHHVGKWVGI